jgi:hypothetical protein
MLTKKIQLKLATVVAFLVGVSLLGIHQGSKLVKFPQDVDAPPFDYAAFWKESLEIALANNKTLAERMEVYASKSCPKVYIYNLSQALRDSEPQPTLASAFGKNKGMDGHLRDTHMWGFAKILEYRLQTSSSCITENPLEADLFYVPTFTKPKGMDAWRAICKRISSRMILKELDHLTSKTACRHFFVVSKGHYAAGGCRGWFSHPVAKLKHAMRLAYSNIPKGRGTDDQAVHSRFQLYINRKKYPNLFSVPYPSNLHWTKNASMPPPWTKFNDRPYLMRFTGSAAHGDVKARSRIAALCESYHNDLICPSDNNFTLDKLATKGQSVFCLEPAGDSPWRRSLSDSLSFGCIPVFFSPLTDETSPFSWGDWKVQARVLVPRQAFVDGQIDLYQLLSTIPLELLELMQDTITRYGRQFHYSLDDDPNDGIRSTLYGLDAHAKAMERKGMCK